MDYAIRRDRIVVVAAYAYAYAYAAKIDSYHRQSSKLIELLEAA